jgi:hypothetical protein
MFGRLGLFVAWLVVWLVVGVALPLVLGVLSLLFGAALRRAAAACVAAARRSQASLGRASMWLSGHRDDREAAAEPRDPTIRVRVVAPEENEPGSGSAEEAEDWMEERLEKEAQRERMRLHARAPARRKFWGR